MLGNYSGKGQRGGEEKRRRSKRQDSLPNVPDWVKSAKERERKCRKHGSREKAGQVECEPTIRTFVIGKREREKAGKMEGSLQ